MKRYEETVCIVEVYDEPITFPVMLQKTETKKKLKMIL